MSTTMPVQARSAGIYLWDVFGPKVLVAFSGREYGNDRHTEFVKTIGEDPGRLVVTKQIHGGNVFFVPVINPFLADQEADGLLTSKTNLLLGMRTADCLPVFFYDPEHHGVGIAHAGWKGIQKNILGGMVRTFNIRMGTEPASLRVAFGPALRRCCYEVGPEFQDFFPRHVRDGKMDLVQAARDQLLEAGLHENHFSDSAVCTFCESGRFFSARREKTGERMLSVIKLTL